jgi:site-specific recombinase XerD
MLNNQHFAQSQTKSLDQLTQDSSLNSGSIPRAANPPPDEYAKARQMLAQIVVKIDGAYAPATIRAYRANFEAFITYCQLRNASPLPTSTETLTSYIAHLANGHLKSASIRIAVVAICAIHRLNRYEDPSKDPDVTLEVRRMYRKLGRASSQAIGVNYATLEKLVNAIDDSLRGTRDRALALLAYDSLCRRSELVALRVEDISYANSEKGLQIRLRKSKTDPNALGKWLHLTKRTQQAIEEWLAKSQITSGFLFRGITRNNTLTKGLAGAQINRIYKNLAKEANLDTHIIEHISGHSMRVGCAQDLLASGATMPILMTRGRWTKTDTVMRYVEQAQLLT